jgi:hypothetical protein
MGTLAAGQVVVLPFPFSDLSRKKLRPALLLADAGRGDWIACQITSDLAAVAMQLSRMAMQSSPVTLIQTLRQLH